MAVAAPPVGRTLVSVRDVSVVFRTARGPLRAVDQVSLDVHDGEVLGIMGESGCGKSTLALALLNVMPNNSSVSGHVTYTDEGDIMTLPASKRRRIRWELVSLVFQGAQNSLNPLERIGKQLEVLGEAHGQKKEAVRKRAVELCVRLQLEPGRVLQAFPHELSGGMKQRVEIMHALVLGPKLVIFDEPTTALDSVTQDLVLRLIRELRDELDLSVVFITHDVAVLAELCTRVAVMYGGRIVEIGPADQVFGAGHHPYTKALMQSIPRLTGDPYAAKGLPGEPPKVIGKMTGCVFKDRCPIVGEVCMNEIPPLVAVAPDQEAACFFPNGRTP